MNSIDNTGSTPLHWFKFNIYIFIRASYLNCEKSVFFLTNFDIDLNLKEKETGSTSLHVAVLSGNYRIVKRLILKGANL